MLIGKKGVQNQTLMGSVLYGLLGIFLVIGVFFVGKYLLIWANTQFSGAEQAYTPINYAAGFDFIDSWLNVLFGPQSGSWQGLLISLGLFFIISMAIGDILVAFSTFSKPVAWSIGFGMGLVASVAGSTSALYNFFLAQIALTGVAVFILILVIIAQGIIINLFFGSLLGRVRMARKIEEDAANTELGAEVAKNAIKGLGKIGEGLTSNAKTKLP